MIEFLILSTRNDHIAFKSQSSIEVPSTAVVIHDLTVSLFYSSNLYHPSTNHHQYQFARELLIQSSRYNLW